MCLVCKREFYCNATCKNRRVDKHECCMMDKKAGVIACFRKPLPHDEGGKLMLMGITGTFMQIEVSKGFSTLDPNEIKRKMLEICAIREIEAKGWEALVDYVGTVMARWSAAMLTAEYDDHCVGLDIMKKAKLTLEMAPEMLVLKYADRIFALKKMINTSIHCLTSVARMAMMHLVFKHLGKAMPDTPGAEPDGYDTAPESDGSDAADASGASRRSKARRSSPQ